MISAPVPKQKGQTSEAAAESSLACLSYLPVAEPVPRLELSKGIEDGFTKSIK
jgi:hypothetical protein